MPKRRREPTPFDPFHSAKTKNRIVFWRNCNIDKECPICLTQLKGLSATVYPCGHFVHNRCDKGLRSSSCKARNKCPMCRTTLPRIKEEDALSTINTLLEVAVLDVHILLEEIFMTASMNFATQ